MKQALLLSVNFPRTGDPVVYSGSDELFRNKGDKGIIAHLCEDLGEYGVEWESGYAAWYYLSDFEGYEGQLHPLEILYAQEDDEE